MLPIPSQPDYCGPATITKSPDGQVTGAWLSQKIEYFKIINDVFEQAFVKHFFIANAKTKDVDKQLAASLSNWRSTRSFAPGSKDQGFK